MTEKPKKPFQKAISLVKQALQQGKCPRCNGALTKEMQTAERDSLGSVSKQVETGCLACTVCHSVWNPLNPN